MNKPTILIADDAPLVVRALARSLRKAGLSFITDTSGERVHELAVEHQPDVIILDVRQNVDGRDLLARLKRDPNTRHLKVVMLSAVDDQFTRRLCLELGADDNELKPFDETFVRKIARLAGCDPFNREAAEWPTGSPAN